MFAGDANAQRGKKSKPACGIKYLPLAEGNSWTYASVDQSPIKRRGIKMPPPASFTATVISVKGSSNSATVTLEESYRDEKKQTTITCDSKGMVVDPQSFFYTGEVGGGIGMTITDIKRSETTWPGRSGFSKGGTWREDIVATVTRAVAPGAKLEKHQAARFEIERTVTVKGKETATTPMGEFRRAQLVKLDIEGRATGEGEKSVGMPTAEAKFWFIDKTGVVRVENRFGHIWELTQTVPPQAAR